MLDNLALEGVPQVAISNVSMEVVPIMELELAQSFQGQQVV